MTLDDLLAYLPDNQTGDISAADMRAVVTGLWDELATVASASDAVYNSLDVRVAALESNDGTLPVVTGRWQVNPQPGVPGDQQVTSDTGAFASASVLRFAKTDQSMTDHTTSLMYAKRLFGQQQDNAANWARFDVTGATDQGAYVELAVTLVDNAGSSVDWVNVVAAIAVESEL